MDNERLDKFRSRIFLAGAAIWFSTASIALYGGLYVFALGLFIWGMVPYGIYWVLSKHSANVAAATAAGTFLVVGNILAHIFIVFFMRSDTYVGPNTMLLVPFWLSVFVLPIGFMAGWIYSKLTEKKEDGTPQNKIQIKL